jgi:hypothetical protein
MLLSRSTEDKAQRASTVRHFVNASPYRAQARHGKPTAQSPLSTTQSPALAFATGTVIRHECGAGMGKYLNWMPGLA